MVVLNDSPIVIIIIIVIIININSNIAIILLAPFSSSNPHYLTAGYCLGIGDTKFLYYIPSYGAYGKEKRKENVVGMFM